MKFKQTQDTEEIALDESVVSSDISINTADADWIIQILSSNLYQYPIESFVRETATNAWDSHIEAGNKDPIIVELKQDNENWYCAITDFGVGLSPDRFNNIYKNIGASTKRNTNGQHGGFGVGRFSSLAASDSAQITSVYDGTKTIYLMYKNGTKIKIDILAEIPTEERNGVSVRVEIGSHYEAKKYKHAIDNQLLFFNNVHLDTDIPVLGIGNVDFNDIKLKRYKKEKFTLANHNIKPCIIIGKVKYPMPNEINIPDCFKYLNIGINFDISELQVLPNRESILINSNVIDFIQHRVDSVETEILDYCSNLDTAVIIDSAETFIDTFNKCQYLKEIELFDNNVVNVSQNQNYKFLGNNYTSKQIRNFYVYYDSYRESCKFQNYRVSDNRIYNSNPYENIRTWILKRKKNLVFRAVPTEMKAVTKAYLKSICDSSRTIRLYDTEKLKKQLEEFTIELLSRVDDDIIPFAKYISSKEMYEELTKDVETVTDEAVPADFIEEYKESRKKTSKTRNSLVGTMTIHNITKGQSWNKVTIQTETLPAKDAIKKLSKRLVVYADMSDSYQVKLVKDCYFLFHNKPVLFIGLSNTNCKLFEEDYDNIVNIKIFMKAPYLTTRELATFLAITEFIDTKFGYWKDYRHIKNYSLLFKNAAATINFLFEYDNNNSYLGNMVLRNPDLKRDLIATCAEKKAFTKDMEIFKKALPEFTAIKELYPDSSMICTLPMKTLLYRDIVQNKIFRPSADAISEYQKKHRTEEFNEQLKTIKDDHNKLY